MGNPANNEFTDNGFFHGQARLFPLPNLVLFPNVMQPLHIFEERYREMMRAALASDKLLAMCLLAPGWETSYEDRPAVHSVACLGRIASSQRLEDGTYNLLLAGQQRIQIVSELDNGRSFREAQVESLPDVSHVSELRQEELRQRLATAFEQAVAESVVGDQPRELLKLFEAELPLASLTDILAYTLQFDLTSKQQLLAEPCIELRAQTLLSHLKTCHAEPAVAPRKFPPDFSEN